ncbi:MAG: ferredoxin, partial [Desulfobulbales bacterium]
MAQEFYIDEDECIACGTCAETTPGCFQFEEDWEVAKVISIECPDGEIQEAMDLCPAQCIHWEEE